MSTSPGSPDDSRYELTISVGEPSFPDGRTRATLDGNGSLLVEHTTDDDDRKEESNDQPLRGELPDARRLLSQAEQFPWESSFPPRPGIPDEAIVTWTLTSPDSRREARFWIGDVEQDERMRGVLTELREGVDRVSDGRYFL